MSRVDGRPDRKGFLRAPWLSIAAIAAIALPVAGVFLLPPRLQHYEALLWLLLVVPACVWSYRRGWRGVATALALGIATLALTYVVAQALGHPIPELLPAVIAAYVLIALAIGLLTDRLARAQYEAATDRLALLDQLTGLPNRRHAELQLEMEFAAAERGRALAVVLFDIDNMQQYNARHGRAAGDGVLIGFASLLRQQKRRMDLAARYGPEEFVAILAGCMEEGAVIFAARVQEHLRAARPAAAVPTVSAGIAVYRPDMLSPEDLLTAAEEALRLAKADGRDRVRIHGRDMDDMREPDSGAVQRAASESLALGVPASNGVQPFEARGRDAIGHGRTACVLATDNATRAGLLEELAREGFQVTAADPADGSRAALQQDFDLVFIELAHGAETAAFVREIRFRSPTSRILGITAGDAAVPAELLSIRMDGHYVPSADVPAARQQMRELLAERDALAAVELSRRQLEAGIDARTASVDRYRALVQSVDDVLLTADADGRLTFLNNAWFNITGFTAEASLGRPLFTFFDADDEASLRSAFDDVLAAGGVARRDACLVTDAGTKRWLDVRLQRTRDGDAGPGTVLGVLTDVTERRRGEEALRQSEAAFRSLIENAGDLMVLLNADGTIRYISPAVRRVLGTDPDDCLGSDAFLRIHPEDVQKAREDLGALLDEPGATRTSVLRLRHVDGSWRDIEAAGRSLLLTAGVEGIVIDGRVLSTARADANDRRG